MTTQTAGQPWRSTAEQGLYEIALLLGGSLLIAAMAQIEVLLPFTPVPITGQTFGVLLVGLLLGSNRGAGAVLLYLGQGLAGMPVFAGGANAVAFTGPTAGYLIAFVPAAFVVGYISERHVQMRYTLGAMLAATAIIYLIGAGWLARFVGIENAVTAGVLPFLPGDAAKAALAAGLAHWMRD